MDALNTRTTEPLLNQRTSVAKSVWLANPISFCAYFCRDKNSIWTSKSMNREHALVHSFSSESTAFSRYHLGVEHGPCTVQLPKSRKSGWTKYHQAKPWPAPQIVSVRWLWGCTGGGQVSKMSYLWWGERTSPNNDNDALQITRPKTPKVYTNNRSLTTYPKILRHTLKWPDELFSACTCIILLIHYKLNIFDADLLAP